MNGRFAGCPAVSMRVAGVVGEDHLGCFRGFGIASEGRVSLVGGIEGRGDASDRQGGDRQLGELVEQLR